MTPLRLKLPDGRVLASQARTLIMGILNVTPDSFSDGGVARREQAERMAEEGADIIDIGGESTRPGHERVTEDDEKHRVLPVLEALAKRLTLPLSIDTQKAAVAQAALAAGASIVNDVWGLQGDAGMAAIAGPAAGAVVMHNRQAPDAAIDIVAEVKAYLARSLAIAESVGLTRERVLIDPGIGFGKTQSQNLQLIARLSELHELGAPILVGLSRKSFLGRILAEDVPTARLYGTIAANVVAARAGASVVRVHDVKAHREALAVAEAIDAAG